MPLYKRSLVLFAALLFALSGCLARLWQIARQDYGSAASSQSSVTVTVATARGTLYDRTLTRLTNTGTYAAAGVVGTPAALAALAADSTEDWAALSERLESGKPAVITADTSLPLADGVRQFTVPRRYGQGDIAAHVIGYLNADGTGACGAEQALNSTLEAASGRVRITYQTDGTGRVLSGGAVTVENTLSRAAAGAALTLDSRLQAAVEALAAPLLPRGAVVVMEVATGDVLAMASFPTFETASLASYLQADDAPLFNRATAAYNCGSVFKIVTAMAALENGVPATQSFSCLGVLRVGSNRIKCHHTLGHGRLMLREAFARSCNPYFIQLAQLMGGQALHRCAVSCGFNSPLVLMNGWTTESATLPAAEALQTAARLANLSIGQGDLLATPLHVAALTACVANGGTYYSPRLYLGTVDEAGNLTRADLDPPAHLCSVATAAALRDMMCAVITDGTGQAAAPTVGTAGGKTGTAETGWLSSADSSDTMVHSWFTGFYPADSPRYAVTVLSENGGNTGHTAAPVFRTVCDWLQRAGWLGRKSSS